MLASFDYVDGGTLLGVFITACFFLSLVRRLYVSGRHDDRQHWPVARHDGSSAVPRAKMAGDD
jgi:hypothetical protein